MNTDNPAKPAGAQGARRPAKADARAQALRANLQKRKQQARARTDQDTPTTEKN